VTVAPEFEELVERLGREADEGFFHTAAQVAVVVDGELVCDAAVGRTHYHEPFTTSTLSALYCTAKPVLTAAMLRLVADDEVSLDDRLADVVEVELPAWMGARTVEQVLGHTAGLHVPAAIISRILPASARFEFLCSHDAPPGAGWYLLGLALEGLTGESFDQYAHRAVVEPYLAGAVDPADLVLRIVDDPAQLARVSATYDLAGIRPVPLLAEVGPRTASEWNPAFGAYGTMRALAQFYAGLLADLDGAGTVLPADLLAEAVAPRLPLTDDVTLGRPAGFGLGFMTSLESHYFGEHLGQRAFGHAGQGGSCFAFADPDRHVAVALLCNAGLDADTALGFRRAALTDAVLRAVDAL